MSIDVKVNEGRYPGESHIVESLDTDFLGVKARLVIDFIVRWGAVAAVPDGEDSKGRQKLRLMTEKELVAKALLSVELATDELAKRGWMIQIPDFKEQESIVAKQQALEKGIETEKELLEKALGID